MHYDIIGDIHGQLAKLETLLAALGYKRAASSWVAPAGRQAVFVGDLIDRGPEQVGCVHTVRRMVDDGHARCVLGNHEFNAIAYATRRQGTNEFLRPRNEKNDEQHSAFLAQVPPGSAEYHSLIDWFRTLPPALDLGPIRVVHAWWRDDYAALVRGRELDDEFMHAASTKGTPEYEAMEGLTRGQEIKLPPGCSFQDKDDNMRTAIRTKWWLDQARTWREYAMVDEEQAACIPEESLPPGMGCGAAQDKPVFVGHYWWKGPPRLESRRVACVDYSAAQDDHPLACYQWRGEAELDAAHFFAAR